MNYYFPNRFVLVLHNLWFSFLVRMLSSHKFRTVGKKILFRSTIQDGFKRPYILRSFNTAILIGMLFVSRSRFAEENALKCYTITVFTCPLLSWGKISNLFSGVNTLVSKFYFLWQVTSEWSWLTLDIDIGLNSPFQLAPHMLYHGRNKSHSPGNNFSL